MRVRYPTLSKLTTRIMDCMDCHNRPSHTFELPDRVVDEAMTDGRISAALPRAKKESVAILKTAYSSRQDAALRSEVTRTDSHGRIWGPRQRITVEEAIRVGTLNGEYASFEENTKGSITPGKLADLVVLGRDPRRIDPMSRIDVPIERTMVGGRWGLRIVEFSNMS